MKTYENTSHIIKKAWCHHMLYPLAAATYAASESESPAAAEHTWPPLEAPAAVLSIASSAFATWQGQLTNIRAQGDGTLTKASSEPPICEHVFQGRWSISQGLQSQIRAIAYYINVYITYTRT